MIFVYLNHNGYYVKGDGIEAALSCSPSLDENGEPFYPAHCQVYAVLAKALNELRGQEIGDEVMVFNDSRVIDEMNGAVSPLDDLSTEFRDRIRKEIIPEIGVNIFFRKKNTRTIMREVLDAKRAMVDVPDKKKKLELLSQQEEQINRSNSVRALNKLKENWNNGKRN